MHCVLTRLAARAAGAAGLLLLLVPRPAPCAPCCCWRCSTASINFGLVNSGQGGFLVVLLTNNVTMSYRAAEYWVKSQVMYRNLGLISIITFDIYKLLEVLLFDFPESKIQFAMCFLCSSQGGSGSASWGDCGEYYCDSPELLLWRFYGAQPIILRLNCYSCQRSFANAFTICGETLL